MPENLNLHQDRIDDAFRKHYPDLIPHKLSDCVKVNQTNGLVKCRFLYDETTWQIEYGSYQPRQIHSLKCVVDDIIEYAYKYINRNALDKLYAQRTFCDDVIIIKQGQITDSFYANIALFDGFEWYTPDRPLLPGVKRKLLLKNGTIKERSISVDDLKSFEKVSLINAMLNLNQVVIPVSKILV